MTIKKTPKQTYKQIICTKPQRGISLGAKYFGIVTKAGFIKVLNDNQLLEIYMETNFIEEDNANDSKY